MNAPLKPDPRFDLVFERTVDVPKERIWAAWTKPEQLKRWYTPAPWTTASCEIDLRPGGLFTTVMRSPEGKEFPNAKCFLEVRPNELLAFTTMMVANFRPAPAREVPFPDFTGVITLEPLATGTKYTVVLMHRDEASCEKHGKMGFQTGWSTTFEQMLAMIKST